MKSVLILQIKLYLRYLLGINSVGSECLPYKEEVGVRVPHAHIKWNTLNIPFFYLVINSVGSECYLDRLESLVHQRPTAESISLWVKVAFLSS